jgi:hypothetical protein
MAKEQVLDFVRRIARSIEQNLEKLQEDDAKLKKLANGIQTFYVSLFDDKKGIILYSIFMTRFSLLFN